MKEISKDEREQFLKELTELSKKHGLVLQIWLSATSTILDVSVLTKAEKQGQYIFEDSGYGPGITWDTE
jgi:hypothetical protein